MRSIGEQSSRRASNAVPLLRYGAPRAFQWLRASDVPVQFIAEPVARTESVGPHVNAVDRDGYDLPIERFGLRQDIEDPNLVSVVENAASRLGTDGKCVVRPVGSVTYARRGGVVLWDLVRDIDLWCYVSDETVNDRIPEELHLELARNVYTELRSRGFRTEYDERTDFVFLVDEQGRRRLVEIKIAPMRWLADGISVADRMNYTVRWRRHRAYFVKPRAEWAAYCAYESHFPSQAAANDFDECITSLNRDELMGGMRGAYHENMAEALRRFGILRTGPATINGSTFGAIHVKLLKKLLFFGYVTHQPETVDFAIDELLLAHVRGDAYPGIRERFRIQADLYERVREFQTVNDSELQRWIGNPPNRIVRLPASREPVDITAATVAPPSLSTSPQ